jgi:hypothetical protein
VYICAVLYFSLFLCYFFTFSLSTLSEYAILFFCFKFKNATNLKERHYSCSYFWTPKSEKPVITMKELITVAARSKAWTVLDRSNRIFGSNLAWGMDVYVSLFCVCVLCVGRGLTTGWSPVQGVLPAVYRIKKLNSGQGPTKDCRGIESERERERIQKKQNKMWVL